MYACLSDVALYQLTSIQGTYKSMALYNPNSGLIMCFNCVTFDVII